MPEPGHHRQQSNKGLLIWLWLAVVGLIVIALVPALNRSHLEGFTYLTETMSILAPDLAGAEPLWQTAQSYFYLSRPGTVWLMVPLSDLRPGQGYELLMWAAMPLFLGGLVITAKLWSGASWISCVATLLCMPIAMETQFFHNDNVIAMAFSLCGIAALLISQRNFTIFLAGALLAAAILCRLDQILFIPLFGALAVLGSTTIGVFLQRGLILLFGLFAVHALMWAVEPDAANILYRMDVVMGADSLWGRDDASILNQFNRDLGNLAIAVGAGLPAIAGGFVIVMRQMQKCFAARKHILDRQLGLPLLLVAYPIAIYMVTFAKYYDPRAFLIFLPCWAPLAALALDRWVMDPLRSGRTRHSGPTARRVVLAAIIVLPIVTPGMPLLQTALRVLPEDENAVPSLTGRLWYGADWRNWQASFHQRELRNTGIIAELNAANERASVVTAAWTHDRQLQYAMAVAGLRPTQPPSDACVRSGESWALQGGPPIHHVRTHVPFLPDVSLSSAAIYVAHGFDCMLSIPAGAHYSTVPIGAFVALPPMALDLTRTQAGLWRLLEPDLVQLRASAAATLTASQSAAQSEDIIAVQIMQNARKLLD